MKKSKVTQFAQLRERTGLSIEDTAHFLSKSPRTIYRWETGEIQPDAELINKLMYIAENNGYLNYNNKFSFKFIDLFAGIGGLRRAFESIGGKCVFTSEWDSACRKTYLANFECDHPVTGDIRDIEMNEIDPFDVLLAGFPCQPFSIAGVSKKNALGVPHGFRDETQGTLFFDVAQILEYHRPKAFLLENVKNLVSHDKGRTFEVMLRTLKEELGYKTVDYRVIDAKGWVPQHRERIFIVGFLDKVDFSFANMELGNSEEGPKLRTILHPENGLEKEEEPYTVGELAKVADKYTLSDRLWDFLQRYAEKHKAKGNGFGYGLVGPDDVARTLSARYYKDGSEILIKQDGKNPRRLTPRECARLMGFDTKEKQMVIPVSDTQAYKQFGNSVVVPVVDAVARHMAPYLTQEINKENKDRKALEYQQLDLFEVAKFA